MPWWVLFVGIAVFVVLRVVLGRRQVDATPFLFLRVPLNAVSFRLRRLFHWRRGAPVLGHEAKEDLYRGAEKKREKELRARYDLAALHARSTRDVYRENLYVLDLLDRLVVRPQKKALSAIDVGSKDFKYATAIERFLSRGGVDVTLTGIEIDGHPVYADLHSRADYGEAYARSTGNPNVGYVVADFLARKDEGLDVVFCFFPFVLRYALVRWGLPLGHFLPEKFFARARDALAPGGLLVIVNHTAEEHARQLELLAEVGLEVVSTGSAESRLVDYEEQTAERVLTVARRPIVDPSHL